MWEPVPVYMYYMYIYYMYYRAPQYSSGGKAGLSGPWLMSFMPLIGTPDLRVISRRWIRLATIPCCDAGNPILSRILGVYC